MADGSSRPIEDIQVGDEVLTVDAAAPERVLVRPVVETWTNRTAHLVRVVAEVNGETFAFEATGEHPIWTVDDGWVAAKALRAGDVLLDPLGDTATVTDVTEESRRSVTHNLTVAGVHSYLILVAGHLVLVHNGGRDIPLDEPGHWNYHLVDASGKPYYNGEAGPEQTIATVKYRHTFKTPRMGPGDKLEVYPGTRTYGEARRFEHEATIREKTFTGRTGEYRGNRQRPIGPRNAGKYYADGEYPECP